MRLCASVALVFVPVVEVVHCEVPSTATRYRRWQNAFENGKAVMLPHKYRCVVEAEAGLLVLAGIEFNTDEVTRYSRGRVFETFETAISSAGQVRMRTADGWVSQRLATDGAALVSCIEPNDRHRCVVEFDGGLIVRSGVELITREIRRYSRGHVFEALETVEVSEGLVRMRTRDGWVTQRLATDGLALASCSELIDRQRCTVDSESGLVVRRGLELTTKDVGRYATGHVFETFNVALNLDGQVRMRTVDGYVSQRLATDGSCLVSCSELNDRQRCVVEAEVGLIVRSGLELTTKEIRKYAPGHVFEIFQVALNSKSQVRMRSLDGWVSLRSTIDGSALVSCSELAQVI